MGVWQDEILDGISTLDVIGTPGTLIVSGDKSQPIVVGDCKSVAIAASEYHAGRVVVFTHDGYISQFKKVTEGYEKLVDNVCKWVSKGQCTSSDLSTFVNLSEVKDYTRYTMKPKVLIWYSYFKEDQAKCTFVERFVRKGGGLITGATPWGYLQLNPNKKLHQLPIYPFLSELGIHYTEGYLRTNGKKFRFPQHVAGDDHHLSCCLKKIGKLCEDTTQHECQQQFDTVKKGLLHLPPEVVSSCVTDDLRKLKKVINSKAGPCEDFSQLCKTCGKEAVELYGAILPILENSKAPVIAKFPGDFRESPITKSKTVNLRSTAFKEVHATGLYLPAGKMAKICTKSKAKPQNTWSVLVGCHCDDLGNLPDKRRWAKICCEKGLSGPVVEVSNPFGGLVYFRSPGEKDAKLSVTVEGVVDAPCFDINDPKAVEKWQTAKQFPGLWADIQGRRVTITLPSSSIRELDDPTKPIRFWDSVIEAHHALRGTSPDNEGRQWLVTDEQPVAGYMHAGYPVVTHLDIANPKANNFILGKRLPEVGSWGLFHEFGHNMQRASWTFEGTVEVTCNLFSLHAFDVLCGVKPWIHPWLKGGYVNNVTKYISNGAKFEQWQSDPALALCIYMQLQAAFGWDVYKRVLSSYEDEPLPEATTPERIDHWIVTFSRVVGFNLSPLFQFWGIPIGPGVQSQLKDLQFFLPDDEITKLVPKVVESILAAHPNCRRIEYSDKSNPGPGSLVL